MCMQDTIWTMLAATAGTCSTVRRPVTGWDDPMTLGLPRLTPDEASDALLSLSMQMCQMANLWPMFGRHIFPFWVEQWWLGVSQQFDRAVHYSDSQWLQNPLKNALDSRIYLAMICKLLPAAMLQLCHTDDVKQGHYCIQRGQGILNLRGCCGCTHDQL